MWPPGVTSQAVAICLRLLPCNLFLVICSNHMDKDFCCGKQSNLSKILSTSFFAPHTSLRYLTRLQGVWNLNGTTNCNNVCNNLMSATLLNSYCLTLFFIHVESLFLIHVKSWLISFAKFPQNNSRIECVIWLDKTRVASHYVIQINTVVLFPLWFHSLFHFLRLLIVTLRVIDIAFRTHNYL